MPRVRELAEVVETRKQGNRNKELAMKELPNPTFALSPVAMPRGSLHQSGHAVSPAPVQRAAVGKISVSWARHQDEVRQAQRLRYQVFALEMGATLSKTLPGHDVDLFDDYC